jgi:1-aminocyclopropane-1-carboxylate deaminase
VGTKVARGLGARLPSPLDHVIDERLADREIQLLLKRDDLIHPEIPGNKWRKLVPNVGAIRAAGQETVLTFGGAHSNHIRAVAAAGAHFDVRTIGVIRGEEHLPLNPALAFAVERGMRLAYLDRGRYRRKNDAEVIDALRREWGDFYLLPEGGSNALGVQGCAQLPAEIGIEYDTICCSVGTGGTLAGIAAGLPDGPGALGFSALKGGAFLADGVRRLQMESGRMTTNWSIETGYHFGGYAKRTPELARFVEDFRDRHGIVLDEGKMLFGIFDLVSSGGFPPGSVIVAVLAG